MHRFLKRLRCQRGTATIEFALCSLFLFGTIMVALDFGIFIQQKLKLGQAVEAGAIMAFNNKIAASTDMTAATKTVSDYIRDNSGTKVQPVVQIYCNSATDTTKTNCAAGRCSCLSATGAFSTPVACSSPKIACPSGGVEGTYMKIEATMTYTAVAVPDRYLGGKDIKQSAVVRLQ